MARCAVGLRADGGAVFAVEDVVGVDAELEVVVDAVACHEVNGGVGFVGVGGADDGVVDARGFPGFAIPVEAGADLPVFVRGVTGGEFDLVGGDVGVDAFAAAVFGAVVAVVGMDEPAVFDFAADANFPAVVFDAVGGAVVVGVVRVFACFDGDVFFCVPGRGRGWRPVCRPAIRL